MNDILLYIIKASLYFSLLLGFYMLFLRKETFHYFKRFYLLSIPVVALLFPLITFQVNKENVIYQFANTMQLQPTEIDLQIEQALNWEAILFWCILCISCLFLGYTLFGLFKIWQLIIKSTQQQLTIGTLCDTQKPISPFSFYHFIVVHKPQHTQNELQQIIKHEQVHIVQQHFIDIIVVQLLMIVSWWNPISWIYRQIVIENLEFIVDQEVLRSGIDKKTYQHSLLTIGINNHPMAVANHFNQSLIKKRIKMMNKQLSNPKKMWKAIFVFPFLFTLFIAISQIKATANIDAQITEALNSKNANTYLNDTIPEDVTYYIDGMEVTKEELNNFSPNELSNISVFRHQQGGKKTKVMHLLTKPIDDFTKEELDKMKQLNVLPPPAPPVPPAPPAEPEELINNADKLFFNGERIEKNSALNILATDEHTIYIEKLTDDSQTKELHIFTGEHINKENLKNALPPPAVPDKK